LIESLILCW